MNKTDILDLLKTEKNLFPPIALQLAQIPNNYDLNVDTLIEGVWNEIRIIFEAECTALLTPKIFSSVLRKLKNLSFSNQHYPLIVAPYLNPQQLDVLEKEEISGIDLCGNGIVIIPKRMFIFKTGQKNKFPSNAPIKNIYKKNSSLICRALLINPQPKSASQLLDTIKNGDWYSQFKHKSSLTFGTISKVLSQLEQELIIDRSNKKVALLQPELLIDNITKNYIDPNIITNATRFKVDMELADLINFISDTFGSVHPSQPVMATGISSAQRYTVMQREEKLSIYCTSVKDFLRSLPPNSYETNRFPNLEIFESRNSSIYYGAIPEDNFLWASPLQTYIELKYGDKRDQDSAEIIKENMINEIKKALKNVA